MTFWLDPHKSRKISPAHRFSDKCRWCTPKGAVLLISCMKLAHFPPKLEMPMSVSKGYSLWLELFSVDTNTVSKLFCTNLLYVYSYLVSTGVFMSLWGKYKPAIICRSQVISPGDVPSYISELHRVTTFIPCLSPVNSTYVRVKREPVEMPAVSFFPELFSFFNSSTINITWQAIRNIFLFMTDQNITSLNKNQNSFIGPANGDICVSQQPNQ